MNRRYPQEQYRIVTTHYKTYMIHHVTDVRTGVSIALASSVMEDLEQDVADAMFRLFYLGSAKEDELEPRMRIRLRRRKR